MSKTIIRLGAIHATALAIALAAIAAYVVRAERIAEKNALEFCGSVQIGDDPANVLARARLTDAEISSLQWQPSTGSGHTLDLRFSGGIPLSVHRCRIEATKAVTGTAYLHRR